MPGIWSGPTRTRTGISASPCVPSCRPGSRQLHRLPACSLMLTLLAGGRAVRRVRQRRGIAGEPGAGAGARDCHAAGDRGWTSPDCPAADHRERADRGDRRRPRSWRRLRRRDAVPPVSDPDGSADCGGPSSWIGARCWSVLSWRCVSAVLFGLAPAIRSTRADLTAVMKATDAAGFGRRRRWGRGVAGRRPGGGLGGPAGGRHVHLSRLSAAARRAARASAPIIC